MNNCPKKKNIDNSVVELIFFVDRIPCFNGRAGEETILITFSSVELSIFSSNNFFSSLNSKIASGVCDNKDSMIDVDSYLPVQIHL